MIGLLTEEQKNILFGKKYSEDCYFNPIKDADGNWVISLEEINQCDNEFKWVKELPLIPFNRIVSEFK